MSSVFSGKAVEDCGRRGGPTFVVETYEESSPTA